MPKQKGGRVTMSSEYYGRNSGRYYSEANNMMGSSSAYGKTSPTSHGSLIGKNLLGPDLGPYPNNTSTQTGGRMCTRKCKKNGCCNSGKDELRCTRNCSKLNCCSITKNKLGGRVVMPGEYYGRNSGRYYSEANNMMGSSSAYGKTSPTSHGSLIGKKLLGPDLGPYPNNTNTQTGGQMSNCECDCNDCNDCKNGVCECTENKCYCNKQKGGTYNKIINPITGRKVNVKSKLGQQIINNYINLLSQKL